MKVSHLNYATLQALHKIPVKKNFPWNRLRVLLELKHDSFTLEICIITGITVHNISVNDLPWNRLNSDSKLGSLLVSSMMPPIWVSVICVSLKWTVSVRLYRCWFFIQKYTKELLSKIKMLFKIENNSNQCLQFKTRTMVMN